MISAARHAARRPRRPRSWCTYSCSISIVARSAGLKPRLSPAASLRDDVKKLPLKQDKKDTSLWIDRARVFPRLRRRQHGPRCSQTAP